MPNPKHPIEDYDKYLLDVDIDYGSERLLDQTGAHDPTNSPFTKLYTSRLGSQKNMIAFFMLFPELFINDNGIPRGSNKWWRTNKQTIMRDGIRTLWNKYGHGMLDEAVRRVEEHNRQARLNVLKSKKRSPFILAKMHSLNHIPTGTRGAATQRTHIASPTPSAITIHSTPPQTPSQRIDIISSVQSIV